MRRGRDINGLGAKRVSSTSNDTIVGIATLIGVVAVIALAGGACYGTMTVVHDALPEEEVWVDEECIDYADRMTQCQPLDEPRLEKHSPGGADVWAGMGAFIGTIWLVMGVGALLNEGFKLLRRRRGNDPLTGVESHSPKPS